jgi:hypothetical protein
MPLFAGSRVVVTVKPNGDSIGNEIVVKATWREFIDAVRIAAWQLRLVAETLTAPGANVVRGPGGRGPSNILRARRPCDRAPPQRPAGRSIRAHKAWSTDGAQAVEALVDQQSYFFCVGREILKPTFGNARRSSSQGGSTCRVGAASRVISRNGRGLRECVGLGTRRRMVLWARLPVRAEANSSPLVTPVDRIKIILLGDRASLRCRTTRSTDMPLSIREGVSRAARTVAPAGNERNGPPLAQCCAIHSLLVHALCMMQRSPPIFFRMERFGLLLQSVGKSSFLLRFSDPTNRLPAHMLSTVGVDFKVRSNRSNRSVIAMRDLQRIHAPCNKHHPSVR